MSLSEIVQETRKQQAMTLREFGDALGVSHNAVHFWEHGERTPDVSFLLLTAAKYSDWRRTWAHNCLAAIQPDLFAPANTEAQ